MQQGHRSRKRCVCMCSLAFQGSSITADCPGNNRLSETSIQRSLSARTSRAWLQVNPDNFYETEIYPDQLARASAGSAVAQLIMQAEAAAAKRSFRLFETELRRP